MDPVAENNSSSSNNHSNKDILHCLSNISIKSPYGYDPIKEDFDICPLSDIVNSTEFSTFSSSALNNKNGKCLVDINKLNDISKKIEIYRSHQKKLVGTLNNIVNEYNTLNKHFKKIQKEFDNFLKYPNENEELDLECNDGKFSVHDTKENNELCNLNKSSSLLIKELSKTLYMNSFPDYLIPLFNEKFEKIIIEEGNSIIKENENDHCLYYLISGEAYVYDFFENKIANIHTDHWFGVFSILGEKRTATIKATLDCKLYKISVDDLIEIFNKDETVKKQFESVKANFDDVYKSFKTCKNENSICRFKNEFLIELTMHILKKIPIFENFEIKFLYDLIDNMIPEVVSKGKIIISRDDEPDCLYCVLNGSVEVFSYPEEKKNNECDSDEVLVHAELSSDSFFGEIGLLLGIRRTSSIRIKEKSFLIKLTKKILQTISDKYPNVQIGNDRRTSGCILAMQENNVNSDSLEQFDLEVNCQNLRKIKLFNNFDNSTLEEIALGMTRKSYQPNEFIIRCDEKAESMFFLTHGSIEVISQNNKVIDIAKGPNVYFGEVALLEDVPRTASVKATSYCSIFVLTKEVLLSVLKKNSQFEAEIEKTSRERLQAHLMRSILA
ncbi:camp-binding domain-like protein [Neocallimastix lanati (nom. inval.)]|jgi:CRP-like cAMP-binding protein|nr:camp-binding domain-like protein [Neocallimastix sp. JGI-2020a]